jgi:hypothetical protein
MGVFFNGRFYIKPTVATFIDDSGLQPVGLIGANVIGMMGPAKDGIPNQGFLLTSLKDAIDIFSEGPLVEGVAAAFSGGAQFIWATRVGGTYNSTTKAFSSAPLRASYATGGSPDIPFKLWSTIYGAHATGIKATFAANVTSGIDITVLGFGNTYSALGVKSDCLKVANGSGTSVVFTIAKSGSAYNLVITSGANTAPTLNLANYTNMIDLVAAINQALATATPAAITNITVTSLNDAAHPIELDKAVTTVLAAGTGYVSKNVKAAYDWLNSGQQPYVTAEDTGNIFTTVENKDISLLNVASPGTDFVLTGGSYGSVDATSYQGVLAEIYEDLNPIDAIVPIVDDYLTYSLTGSTTPDSIFNYAYLHAKHMSTLGSDERKAYFGYQFSASDGDADTLVTTLASKATNFNSQYAVICSPRLQMFSQKGDLKTFNGTYTAAFVTGMIANFPVGEPITNKTVSGIVSVSTVFKNRQIITLLDAGVLTIERLPSGIFRIVQGITTWITDDNFNKKEISVGLASNFVAKNCRSTLSTFVGKKNSPFVLQTIKGALIQILKDLESQEVIVGTTEFPAFRNIIISADGDIVRISFECSPVLPINYVLITVHATIFKTTI